MIRAIDSSKNFDSISSSIFVRLLGALLFILVLFFGIAITATYAHAQDGGWEITVGAGYNGIMSKDWAHNEEPTYFNHGFAIVASAGYRFTKWFSLNLEQSLVRCYENTEYNYHTGSVINGETNVTVKFIATTDSRDAELYIKLGVGMVYGTYYEQGEPDSSDSTWDSSGIIWNIPLGVGMNFYFTDMLGVGADIEWDSATVVLDGELKATVHLAMRF